MKESKKPLTDQLVNLILQADKIGLWNLDRDEIVKLAKQLKRKLK
jgi:hypothetical protein